MGYLLVVKVDAKRGKNGGLVRGITKRGQSLIR